MGACSGRRGDAAGPVDDVEEPVSDDPLGLGGEYEFIPIENRIMNFHDQFEEEKELGHGSTCSVWVMREKITDRHYAVKVMKRSHKSNSRGFKRESQILLKINHNHVVGLHGLFVDPDNFYISQELCTGGMVLDRVKTLKAFSEHDAIEISYQILDAVRFLHDHNVVHRDIKPDNIVYQSERNNRIVLIDFGQAREIRETDEFKDWVGTPAYMAPEVTRTRSGAELKKVDVWAVGITVFILLTGHLPFFGRNVKELLKEVCQKKLTFPKSVEVPTPARKFIASLLRRNVPNRPTAAEAMQHDWIESDRARTTNHYLKAWTDNLSSYRNATKLKQLVVDVAIQEMDSDVESILGAAFNLIDTDQDGSIQEEEMAEFLKKRGMTTQRAEDRSRVMFMAMAGEDAKEVGQEDFAKSHVATQIGENEQEMERMFAVFDLDGDGKISVGEIKSSVRKWFNESVGDDDAAQILAEVDRNGDGFITIHEFKDAMRHLTVRARPMDMIDEEEHQ